MVDVREINEVEVVRVDAKNYVNISVKKLGLWKMNFLTGVRLFGFNIRKLFLIFLFFITKYHHIDEVNLHTARNFSTNVILINATTSGSNHMRQHRLQIQCKHKL